MMRGGTAPGSVSYAECPQVRLLAPQLGEGGKARALLRWGPGLWVSGTMAKNRDPKSDPERIAQILADASLHGDKEAAKRHGISPRTVYNYRKKYGNDSDVSTRFQEKKSAISQGWIEEVRRVRFLALHRMETLLQVSDDLREVTGATKILNDAVLAERVVSDGLGDGGAESAGPGQAAPEAPVRTIALFKGGKAS